MANPLRPERVLAALNMALGQRRPEGVVHHSDNGTRYTSLAFGKRCREMGVVTSTGDGYDNAMAGSFFATLECERLDRRAFHTQVEARMVIFEFIEGWYNTHRRHSALGSLSPNDFERAAAKAASRAPGNDDRLGRIDLEAFRIDEPEARTTLRGDPQHRSSARFSFHRRSPTPVQGAKAITCPHDRGKSTLAQDAPEDGCPRGALRQMMTAAAAYDAVADVASIELEVLRLCTVRQDLTVKIVEGRRSADRRSSWSTSTMPAGACAPCTSTASPRRAAAERRIAERGRGDSRCGGARLAGLPAVGGCPDTRLTGGHGSLRPACCPALPARPTIPAWTARIH